jgi:hypothetical protein
MDPKLHLRVVAYFIEANATYSDSQQARTISLDHLSAIYDRIVRGETAELTQPLPQPWSLDDALHMGARQGLWTMQYDQDADETIVVLR